jgi:hypothetical protein
LAKKPRQHRYEPAPTPRRVFGLGMPNSRPPPEHVMADRDRRREIEAQHDPIRTLFGDPVPGTGRSALDRRGPGTGPGEQDYVISRF